MYLKFYLNDDGKRVYTLKSVSPEGKPTQSAHPARFSPGKKFYNHNHLRCICLINSGAQNLYEDFSLLEFSTSK